MSTKYLVLAAVLALATPGLASDAVRGRAVRFTGPEGRTDMCVVLQHIPGGSYSEDDARVEAGYCGIDLFQPSIGVCPKTWSTSPGMVVFDLSAGPYAGDPDGFERNACSTGRAVGRDVASEIALFKSTMNTRDTSGTFAPAALLYYHLSRYFDTVVDVPVAVFRTIDRDTYLSRVVRPGVAQSGHSHSSQMNHAAWQVLVKAHEDPATYSPTDELFTTDRRAIHGVLLNAVGDRYNSEINGTRRSGWGAGQNRDFQETAPFLALRAERPLVEAIAEGIAAARRDPQLAKDMGAGPSRQQMAYWMRELSEIALLDFILSQQDRIGNIDFVSYWYWTENEQVQRRAAARHESFPPEAAPYSPVFLKRSRLNDNDAAGRLAYANFAKQTEMLEKIRHLSQDTYTRLMALDAEFNSRGQLYDYVSNTFGLSPAQVRQIVSNTRLAAGILRSTCRTGSLRFDLEPEEFMTTGATVERTANCGVAQP